MAQDTEKTSPDPLHCRRDTQIGFAIGFCIALAIVITVFSGTHHGDILKKFFNDIANTLCNDVFGAANDTPKNAIVAAKTGIFSLFTLAGMGACGLFATLPRRIKEFSKAPSP